MPKIPEEIVTSIDFDDLARHYIDQLGLDIENEHLTDEARSLGYALAETVHSRLYEIRAMYE